MFTVADNELERDGRCPSFFVQGHYLSPMASMKLVGIMSSLSSRLQTARVVVNR